MLGLYYMVCCWYAYSVQSGSSVVRFVCVYSFYNVGAFVTDTAFKVVCAYYVFF